MASSVPREAQQLVCVRANELGDVKDFSQMPSCRSYCFAKTTGPPGSAPAGPLRSRLMHTAKPPGGQLTDGFAFVP
jgi:hypothetical protein